MSSDPQETEPPDDGPVGDTTAVINVDEVEQFPEDPGEQTACITVMSGPHVGRMESVEEGAVTLGRDRDCDLCIPDDKVSRNHARIFPSGEDYIIEDLDSSNGTLVENRRIEGEYVLKDGDKITVGDSVTLKFAFQDAIEQSFQQEMYEAALRDNLTGAYNKSFLHDHLESEISFARRHETDLSLILFDIDHFKEVNDTYGHVAGDAILRKLAKITRSSIRTEDIFARYGGEEFAIVLREIDQEGAEVLADRLRHMIEQQKFIFDGEPIPVTVSVGVASLLASQPEMPTEFIAAADQALYRAKDNGRNQVCLYQG